MLCANANIGMSAILERQVVVEIEGVVANGQIVGAEGVVSGDGGTCLPLP